MYSTLLILGQAGGKDRPDARLDHSGSSHSHALCRVSISKAFIGVFQVPTPLHLALT